MTEFHPRELRNLIEQVFCNDSKPAYGQAATADPSGVPRVRTVHYRYLPDAKFFGFATHIASKKWLDLEKQPLMEGCLFREDLQVQLRWRATADQLNPNTTDQRINFLIDQLWKLVRPDVRAAYWEDFDGSKGRKQEKNRPKNFAGVSLTPTLWDIYTLAGSDYREGHRTIYTRTGSDWASERTSLLRDRRL